MSRATSLPSSADGGEGGIFDGGKKDRRDMHENKIRHVYIVQ